MTARRRTTWTIGVRHSLLAIALLFFPPALSSGAALGSVAVFGVGARIYKPVAIIFALMLLTSACAFWAAYFNGNNQNEGLEALKFIFMGFCLVSGFWVRARQQDIQALALVLSILVVLWYMVTVRMQIELTEAIRPPDNNGASILLFFLAFMLTENRGVLVRLLIMASLFFFANMVDSRLLLVLLPFFFLNQPMSLSIGKVALFVVVCAGVFVWTTSTGMWGSWSDLVRLALYASVIETFVDPGVQMIASGQSDFIYEVNRALPSSISNRLEVVHAHNAFFQVLGGYGWLAGLCFVSAFAMLFYTSIKLSSDTLRNQTLFLVAAMMIETLISDSRIAYVAFLFIGLQIGAATRQ